MQSAVFFSQYSILILQQFNDHPKCTNNTRYKVSVLVVNNQNPKTNTVECTHESHRHHPSNRPTWAAKLPTSHRQRSTPVRTKLTMLRNATTNQLSPLLRQQNRRASSRQPLASLVRNRQNRHHSSCRMRRQKVSTYLMIYIFSHLYIHAIIRTILGFFHSTHPNRIHSTQSRRSWPHLTPTHKQHKFAREHIWIAHNREHQQLRRFRSGINSNVFLMRTFGSAPYRLFLPTRWTLRTISICSSHHHYYLLNVSVLENQLNIRNPLDPESRTTCLHTFWTFDGRHSHKHGNGKICTDWWMMMWLSLAAVDGTAAAAHPLRNWCAHF